MNKKLFLITPYQSDSEFESKKKIVLDICKDYDFALELAATKNDVISDGLDSDLTLRKIEIIDFFIADLSYERPSCYFEVGYAQCAGKNVSLIAKTNTLIHQVAKKSAISYYSNLEEYEQLIFSIIQKISKIIY